MLKNLLITIALLSFLSVFTFAQEKPETEKKEKQECVKGSKDCCEKDKMHSEMKSDDNGMHGMHHKMKSDSTEASSIIREGEIDLAEIDMNKDGKVFQDQMCWNVISDEAGECPQCGMILKEVSLEKAKENLIKHDFKVKGNN